MAGFFISYTKADQSWAEWIAWQLEAIGQTTVIQAWDFKPGQNFVLEMQKAVLESDYTIAVLSENYLKSLFTHPEWATAFAKDPMGNSSRLIPIKIDDCTPPGLLRQIIYIDIAGYMPDKAKAILTTEINKVIYGEHRGKPFSEPVLNLMSHLNKLEDEAEEKYEEKYKYARAQRDLAQRDQELKKLQDKIKKSNINVNVDYDYYENYPGLSPRKEMREYLNKGAGDDFLRNHIDAYIESNGNKFKKKDGALKVSLVLLDIDDLTVISKIHGTVVGSKVIMRIMDIILTLAGNMKCGRCGDDTYYILLLGYSATLAKKFAVKLCRSVKIHNWNVVSKDLQVTVSLGVVKLNHAEPTIDLVIRAANGFKLAKKEGGNQVALGPVILEKEESRLLRDHYS